MKKRTPRTTACFSALWALTDSDFLTSLVQAGPGEAKTTIQKFWEEEGRDQSVVFVDDLSRTGLRVTGDQCLPPDNLVLVRAHLTRDLSMDCIARVVWSRGWRKGLPVHFAGLKILWIDRLSAQALDQAAASWSRAAPPGSELAEGEKAKWIRLKSQPRVEATWDKKPVLNLGSRPLLYSRWMEPDDGLVRLNQAVCNDYYGLLEREYHLYLSFDFVTRLFSVFGVPGARSLGEENLPGMFS